MQACRHCGNPKVNRPRGLCWRCFRTVRDLYPPIGASARGAMRSAVASVASGRVPAEPTATRPGSPERLAVLAERAARGESLWHPGDATTDLS